MRPDSLQTYDERIRTVLLHIRSTLAEPQELDTLARLAHFSPFHFHRVFHGMVGETVYEHVRRLRLERAAGLLRRSRHSITRIAFEVGYESHEVFTRAFRARFGMTPSAWRRANAVPALAKTRRSDRSPVKFLGAIKETLPMLDIQIRRMPPERVAFLSHTGPYQEVGETWNELVGTLAAHGDLRPGAKFIGLSYDDPDVTAPDHLRYDACITVAPNFVPSGRIGVQELQGGLYAIAMHQGPYTNLGKTYAAMCGQWAPANHRELRHEPCLEFYLNDPCCTEPEELLTQVCVPIEENLHD